MTKEEFVDLLEIMQAMIDRENARDTSDGGLNESVRLGELKLFFLERHVEE